MTVAEQLARLYARESGRLIATLVRWLGDIDRAEDALQAAFEAALATWDARPPEHPAAWLLTTARNKGIDALRARRATAPMPDELPALDARQQAEDPLRLLFTCCHPVLPVDGRVALALRVVCGLTTTEIARAFLVPPETMKRRITRAKAALRDRKIPYRVPEATELEARLDAVLHVIYLVFNEGHSATEGPAHIRPRLVEQALKMGRLLVTLHPAPEATGLLGLMCLHAARTPARIDDAGDIVPLDAQDRSRWHGGLLGEGLNLTLQALQVPQPGVYALQAAIASVHMSAPSVAQTDWRIIVGYYDRLLGLRPSSVVALNRAIAIGMRDGPAAGLIEIDALMAEGGLATYSSAHAARGDLAARAGRLDVARAAFQRALEYARQGPERRYLLGRLSELSKRNVPVCQA
jgi:RNA polymerase sigma-70 factor (ECF subfamily)